MTIFSLFGVFLAILAIPALLRPLTFDRLAIALGIVGLHTLASYVYYFYTQTDVADAYGYYYFTNLWSKYTWLDFGSPFIGHVTQFLRTDIGASYADTFMIFQACGVWGIMLMMRTFYEIHEKLSVPETKLSLYVLFVPGLHFWTSAVGKDAPIFLAIALCVWAMLKLEKRWPYVLVGFALMVPIRAHIALAIGIALILAAVFHQQVRGGRKLLLGVLGIVALGFLLSIIKSNLEVDLTNPGSIAEFMQVRGERQVSDTSNTSYGQASYAFRLISLYFRPFFFDATNAFGLVASIENLGSLLMVVFLLRHLKQVRLLSKQVLFIRFCVTSTVVLSFVLILIVYNVGLGLRERVMIIPPLLSLFLATWAFSKRKVAGTMPGPAAAVPLGSAQGRAGSHAPAHPASPA